MGSEWFNLLTYFTILSPILPLTLLAIDKQNISDLIRKLLIGILLFSLVSDLTSLFLSFKSINNHPVIHIYTLLIGVTYFYFYSLIIDKSWMKTVFIIATAGLIITFLIESLICHQFFYTNRFAYAYLSIFLVVLSLAYFFSRIDVIQTRSEIFDYLFWINCAILIYFGSTFVLTIFENLIESASLETFYPLWTIQLISNILFNLIIAKGIWIAKKT